MDIPFARKVLEYAEAEYEMPDYRFDMFNFFTRWTSRVSTRDKKGRFVKGGAQIKCHTVACLAGTAVMLHPTIEMDDDGDCQVNGVRTAWWRAGKEALGITSDEAQDLFFPGRYPGVGANLNQAALDRLETLIESYEAADEKL